MESGFGFGAPKGVCLINSIWMLFFFSFFFFLSTYSVLWYHGLWLTADQESEYSFIKRKYNKIKNKQLIWNAFENHLKYRSWQSFPLRPTKLVVVSIHYGLSLPNIEQYIYILFFFFRILTHWEEEKPILRTTNDVYALTHTHTLGPLTIHKLCEKCEWW